MAMSQEQTGYPRPLSKEQFQEGGKEADREKGGRTTYPNGQGKVFPQPRPLPMIARSGEGLFIKTAPPRSLIRVNGQQEHALIYLYIT